MSWPTPPLGSLVETIVPARDKPIELTGPVPWVRIEDFNGKYLSGSKSGQGVTEATIRSMPLRVFPEGTVVCSCSCTMGTTAIVRQPLVTNQTFIGLLPRGEALSSEFLYYALQGHRDRLTATATGAIQSYLSREDFRSLRIPVPPLPTQRAIADYLDRETARIDALIEKKRILDQRVEEWVTALMHELTSRGIRGAATVHSGIGWLGDVPRHWEVKPIRRIATVRRGASPRPIDDPKYFDDNGEFAWVRISDLTASSRYLEKTQQQLSALGSSLSAKMSPGSLFVSIAGSVGKPIITKIPCCIHDGFVYFERLAVRPEYLYYLFRASQLFRGLGKLGTQLNLNTATIGGIAIPVPPVEEQEEIVAELDSRLAASDRLLHVIRNQIALLQERRQALVAAAVTGQLDIPEAA